MLLSAISILFASFWSSATTLGSRSCSTPTRTVWFPRDLVQIITDFCCDKAIRALFGVSKKYQNETRHCWLIRRDQTASRNAMIRIWKQLRRHHQFPFIFGSKTILNTSSSDAIEHLIHDFDGSADLLMLAQVPMGADPLSSHDVRALLIMVRGYQGRYSCGPHNIYPPHRYERVRCNISDSKMKLFDDYVLLFSEFMAMRSLNNHFQGSSGVCLLRMMELIGARIQYPNMKFFSSLDVLPCINWIEHLCKALQASWDEVPEGREFIRKLRVFERRMFDTKS